MNKREKVFSKTNGKCIYCGCNIDVKTFNIEHRIPKKHLKSDYDNITNLFPACQDCNYSKGELSVDEFRKKIENMIFDKSVGRIMSKYYGLEPIKVKFYFEIDEVE